MIYLKGLALVFGLGLVLTGAWCVAGAVDSIWNAWLIHKRRQTSGRLAWANAWRNRQHPDYGTPNWCPKCSPKGLGYCRCEIASNE